MRKTEQLGKIADKF